MIISERDKVNALSAMNDLTKDELIKLKNGLEYLPNSVSISKKYWNECEEIIRKLQSMIDSYCDHEFNTADMKEYQVVCTLHENTETYSTIESDVFAFGSHASLDAAHKIICTLAIGGNKFDSAWIDRIIFRLEELKRK